jgi:hypothetical protein
MRTSTLKSSSPGGSDVRLVDRRVGKIVVLPMDLLADAPSLSDAASDPILHPTGTGTDEADRRAGPAVVAGAGAPTFPAKTLSG